MAQPQAKESVTKIDYVNGEWVQTYLAEDIAYGDALGMVWRLRRFMNHLIEDGNLTEHHRTYYRLGRPHR